MPPEVRAAAVRKHAAMCVYFYRAYDDYGEEKKGVVDAPDERTADRRLRRSGLKPFFICDYAIAKRAAHDTKVARQRRHRLLRRIVIIGAAVILLAFAGSFFVEDWAGGAVAPDIEQYTEAGILAGASNVIYGATPQERALALEFAEIWERMAPDTLDGLEASRLIVAVHVNNNIVGVNRSDTEMLMAQFLRAMRRRFGTSGPTVLLVYSGATLAEATYDESAGAVVVTYY